MILTLPHLLVILSGILFFISIILIIISNKKNLSFTGKEIAEGFEKINSIEKNLNKLSDIFMMPYARGGLGESILETLISNWLPKDSYKFQYNFKSGARADAVIFLNKFIISIDSKFPLESISSANSEKNKTSNEIKRIFIKHAKDISEKYIKPDEGTLNFALMYIPSEKLYYMAFIENNEILDEMLRRGVVPVSPSGLFLYIQTIVYGLKGFTFHDKQKEFRKLFFKIKNDYDILKNQFMVVNTHLKNLNKAYDEALQKDSELEKGINSLGEM